MFKIKFFVIFILVAVSGIVQANIKKSEQRSGNHSSKKYTQGNHWCEYMNSGSNVGYVCDNDNSDTAQAKFNELECAWCKENNQTTGACSACPK